MAGAVERYQMGMLRSALTSDETAGYESAFAIRTHLLPGNT